MKEDKANDSSCPPSWPDTNNKDSEEEQKYQQRKDAQLLDKNFSVWHDPVISKGGADWEKRDTMTCDHRDPCKELRYLDPTSPPLDYMKHCRVFKAKKTNEYDLCHFYRIEISRDLPTFPSPCEPATHKMLKDFLLKAQALGCPNLVVAFAQDSTTAVCLLQELHSKDSLRCLPMELKPDAGGKAIKKLSFCPLCLYNGSNDLLYMNHIVYGHYNANYGCGQCLKEVFTMGQQLKNHLKICAGFPKANTPSSSAKKSSGEGSHSKVHKKSNRRKEEMPKKEKHHGGTKQTRASLTSPARSEPHRWRTSDIHPFTAMHAKGGVSVFLEVLFQL